LFSLTLQKPEILDDENINFWFLKSVSPMKPHQYRHQIFRWKTANDPIARYRLHIEAIALSGESIHRAQWEFETFRGLLTFLNRHFPEIDAGSIQFQVA